MKTCEDCGCKVYSGNCVNCHEEIFILEQYEDLGMKRPEDGGVFMDAVNKLYLNKTIKVTTDNAKVNAELLKENEELKKRLNEAVNALVKSNTVLAQYTSERTIKRYLENDHVINKNK